MKERVVFRNRHGFAATRKMEVTQIGKNVYVSDVPDKRNRFESPVVYIIFKVKHRYILFQMSYKRDINPDSVKAAENYVENYLENSRKLCKNNSRLSMYYSEVFDLIGETL